MKDPTDSLPYKDKVRDTVLFVIDAITRKKMKGMRSDSDICRMFDWAVQTIHYWRSGERWPTINQIGSLIYGFDINPVFLFKQEGSPWGEAELMLRMKTIEDRQDKTELRIKELELLLGTKSGTKQPKNGKR